MDKKFHTNTFLFNILRSIGGEFFQPYILELPLSGSRKHYQVFQAGFKLMSHRLLCESDN